MKSLALLFAALQFFVAIAGAQSITGFRLIDSDTDLPVAGYDPIPEGATIYTAVVGTNLNIEAITSPATDFGSVRFNLSGATTITNAIENVPPWALGGDSGGDFDPVGFNNGSHSLTATAHTGDGASGTQTDSLTLNFTVTESVQHDFFDDALVLSGALPITTAGISNDDATAESGEPDHDFNSIAAASIWYSYTATSTGPIEINTFGSTPSDPTPGLQFDTVLAVYTGGSLGSLTKIIGGDDNVDPGNGNTKQSRVRFIAQSGVTYRIAVDGFAADRGTVILNILSHAGTRPSNDEWANAEFMVGPLPQTNDQSPTSTTKSNVDATIEHNEPQHVAESAFSASVWYAWTATTSGSVAAHTTGSSIDTVMSVYRGSSLGNLTLITENDDNESSVQSTVQFFAQIGVTYYFAVDGFDGEEGEILFLLQWGPSPPPNDDLASAQVLGSGHTVNVDGPSGGATSELSEPQHVIGQNPYSSIWYEWTAPVDVSSSVEVNTFGSNYDTVLAVYLGSSYVNLNKIASNDDAGVKQSRVRFSPIPNTTYRIAVDGKEGGQGAVFLEIKPGPTPPANDDWANAEVIAQNSFTGATGNNFGATVEGSEPDHFTGVVADGSVWYHWTANADSDVRVSTEDSDFDTVLAVYEGTSLATLTKLASNDNAGGIQAQLVFNATQDQSYYIAVTGKGGGEGNIDLSITAVGSYAAWLENWPALVGTARKHAADTDGDGFTNAVELLCGLNPTINSRPGGGDPNASNAPVIIFNGLDSVAIRLTTDPTYVGAVHNGGQPIAFGGRLLSTGLTPGGPVTPTLTGPSSYEIATNFVAETFRLIRLEVSDPNG